MKQMRRRVAKWLKYTINRQIARWTLRRYRKTLVRCEACHQWVAEAFLMPIPGEAGGIELRCNSCRREWHRAIQEFYTKRLFDQAAARYDGERTGRIIPASPAPAQQEAA